MEEVSEKKLSNVDLHLLRNYKRLRTSIFVFSFTKGFNFTAALSFFLIYQTIYKVQLYEYVTIELIMLIPAFLWPFFGFIIDLVPLCGYKLKSYLFIIYILEIITYYLTFLASIKKLDKNLIIASQFVYTILSNFKELIFFSLSLVLKNKFQTIYHNVTFDSSVTSLSVHYGSKFLGRLVGFLVIYLKFDDYRKLNSFCFLLVDLDF